MSVQCLSYGIPHSNTSSITGLRCRIAQKHSNTGRITRRHCRIAQKRRLVHEIHLALCGSPSAWPNRPIFLGTATVVRSIPRRASQLELVVAPSSSGAVRGSPASVLSCLIAILQAVCGLCLPSGTQQAATTGDVPAPLSNTEQSSCRRPV